MVTPEVVAVEQNEARASTLKTLGMFVLPILLLAGVIALFLVTGGAGLNVQPAAPLESLAFERTVLKPGMIELHVQNTSPQAITLAQVNVRDSIVPFTVSPHRTIARLGRATVTIPYPWVQGNPYAILLFSSNAIPHQATIDVASETRSADTNALLSFTLIGLYVGVIPVLLGVLWFPALRRLGSQAFTFLMAATVGLLIFLGIDATSEGLEQARELGGPLQGVGLVSIGIIGAFLLLDAISRRRVGSGRSDSDQRLTIATMIAVGIGLHNLGEGLAIGAAYSVGAAALGTFLVIGFIIQNITEGLGIIAPIVKDRPSPLQLALLGIIGGGPAIVGAWIGGLVSSSSLAVLFLAIGAGAVFAVVWQIARLIHRDTTKRPMPVTVFAGVLTGMAILYLTGFLVK